MKLSIIHLVLVALFTLPLQAQVFNAHIINGDQHIINGNWQAALDAYNNALEMEPENVSILLKRANLYQLYGMHREAAADYATADAINPYARVYLNEDLRNKMLAKQDYGYTLDNEDEDGFSKDSKLTDQYLQLLQDVDLNSYRDTLVEVALLAIVDQNYALAESILTTLTCSNTCTDLAYDLRGLLHHKAGNVDSAIYYYTKAIDTNPDFVIAYHNRAVAYTQIGQLRKAEQDFYTALSINGNISNLYFGLAKIYQKQADSERALDLYELAASIDTGYYQEARLNHAALLQTLGNYTEALIAINEVIDTDESHIPAYFIRAGIHTIYGEYELAVTDLKVYLGRYPSDAKAQHNIGFNYAMLGDNILACMRLNIAADLGNTDAQEILPLMCRD